MRHHRAFSIISILALLFCLGVMPAWAEFSVQCPPDVDGIDTDGDGDVNNDHVCVHLSSGDGFIKMADGRDSYIFGFASHRLANSDPVVFQPEPGESRPPAESIGLPTSEGGLNLGATFPAPTIEVREGQKLYLTLSNVGMLMRPDLFDPHTVHYHGFPNVASIFDGLPDSAISINMGFSLTYFYNLVEPGTFMYHCHVEATEHMQMGMLGNIYVRPMQDLTDGTDLGYPSYAYNDGDGTTGYHVAKPLQIHSFDPNFHDANELVQPLPFALMHDRYPMFNGRGYPDTLNPDNIANQELYEAQLMDSIIEVPQGERVLLRLSSLATVDFYTVASPSIPMTVVGQGARILRTAGETDGVQDLFYTTHSVTLGGGEAKDILLDTTDIPEGTYFIYTTNLNNLSNDQEDYGGMMTEIVVQAAAL
ncbi:MAG: multicopper oxidase domain-containing protein [Desulfuromonadales bacterium]|nr:multicopper oxidase domain-containing protein [Desulfuromonadales bacterium]